MIKRTKTILLTITLAVCLLVLGLLIFLLTSPQECKHHFCKTTPSEPTCAEKGYTIYECLTCDYSFEADFIAPKGHDFTFSVIEPTCESEGYTIQACLNCEFSQKTDYTSAKGHDYTSKVTNPTCISGGFTTYSCANCDFEYDSDFTSPKGHVLSKSKIAPTCKSEGHTKYSCKNCDYSYISDVVAPLEHSFEKEYVRPSIGQTGYTIYTCSECKSEHKDDYVFYSDIFSGAEGEGKGSLAFGVDLSHHSDDVDFEALKSSGVEFVILRVGYDTDYDTRFDEYYAAAKRAGLDIGIYFFTLAKSKEDAIADAERVARWLDGKKFEYPVFYDVEKDLGYSGYDPSTLSEELLMEIAQAFMTKMIDLGYYPGLYTNNYLLYSAFNSEKALSLYDVWCAHYTDPTSSKILEYSKIYSMWQYDGDVEGYAGAVSGMCDLNYVFKNYPEIIKKHGFNGY